MKRHLVFLLWPGILFCLVAFNSAPAAEAPNPEIPRDTVRQYFKMIEALNPKLQGQDLF